MSDLRRSLRVHFPGSQGVLSGILDRPVEEPKAYLLFSHCFTCSKDLKAIVRISRRLAEHGYGVLRYDFTGVGESQGDFAKTHFTSTQFDLEQASDFLEREYRAPVILIGHSFGGATSLAMTNPLGSVRGTIVLAGPSNTVHLADLLERLDPRLRTEGHGEVTIGGKKWPITQAMLSDLRSHDLPKRIAELEKPILIFHSLMDETLGYDHAMRIFSWVMHREAPNPPSPGASLITLPKADHLLVDNPADVQFVADTMAVWIQRLLAGS